MALNLKAPQGAVKKGIIVGRGRSSKRGGTSGSGNNGQNARSGGGVRPGFEGGQMPLYRRIAIRGFSNARFRTEYKVINLQDLEKNFNDGDVVDMEALIEKGLIKGNSGNVKLLANGELTKKLEVKLPALSAVAAEKVKKAGGSVVCGCTTCDACAGCESDE